MNRILLAASFLLCSSVASLAQEALPLGTPGCPSASAVRDGALVEDWGRAVFSVACEGSTAAEARERDCQFDPGPAVALGASSGTLALDVLAYRAPMFQAPCDVAEVTLTNTSGAAATGELVLRTTGDVSWGEVFGESGGRAVVRLPEGLSPIREARAWGCASGSRRLPGWGHPALPCDPAYESIRADFAKEPIVYRFRVQPGSRHQVFVGLLESHWATAGSRPVTLFVEGAPKTVVDPVGEFGQHKPGCVAFEAFDKNGDGMLQVVSASGPGAADPIPILNAIWVFGDDDFLPSDEVLRGEHSRAAEYYVDCGGPDDQELYAGGDLRFPVTLAAGESRTYPFLFATAGGSLATGALPATAALRAASSDVWTGWLGKAGRRLDPACLEAACRLALAEIQADDFYFVVEEPGGGVTLATQALAAIAYDRAGMHAQAERLLRALWDPATPAGLPLAPPDDQGAWAGAQSTSSALALYALAQHALVTGDTEWTGRALPTIERAARGLAGGTEPPCAAALGCAARVPGLDQALATRIGGSGGAPPQLPLDPALGRTATAKAALALASATP